MGDQDLRTTTTYEVELLGVPDPDFDGTRLLSLATEANTKPEDLFGVWEGTFDFYLSDRHLPYDFKIDIIADDKDGLPRINVVKGITAGDSFSDVTYNYPVLTMAFEGFLYSTEDESLPLKAKMYLVDPHLMRGHYKQLISERGGQQYYTDYDVTMKRSR